MSKRDRKSAKRLAVALDRNRVGVATATVIRFRRQLGSARKAYTYAALFIEATQRWYVTGTGGVADREYSTEELLSLLNQAATSDVQVATEWEEIR